MSSVFSNLLAMCKQTFSDLQIGFISGKERDNTLCICYQQGSSVQRCHFVVCLSLKQPLKIHSHFIFLYSV